MYKATGKAAYGKEQFDDADRKGVCVKFPKYMDTDESNGESKLPPIIEKYRDIDAKIWAE